VEKWHEGGCDSAGSRGAGVVGWARPATSLGGTSQQPESRQGRGLAAQDRGSRRGLPGGAGDGHSNHHCPVPPHHPAPSKYRFPLLFPLSLTKISSLQEFSMARESYQALFVPFIYETPFDLSAKCSKHCNIKLLSLQH